jgi:acyl transferase domain-containing protein
LSVEDALKLLGARCRLIDGLERGKMIAVKENEEKTKEMINNFTKNNSGENFWLDIAATNSSEQTTLSGPEEAVLRFKDFCSANNTKSHVLDATHAFHSRAMDKILKEYEAVAQNVVCNKPNLKFISGVDGKTLEKLDEKYWVRHNYNFIILKIIKI